MSEDFWKDKPLNDESRETDRAKRARTTIFLSFFVLFAYFTSTTYIIHRIIKECVCGHYKHLSALGKSLRQSPQMRVIERAAARGTGRLRVRNGLTGFGEDLSLLAEFARRRSNDSFRVDVNFPARREGSFDIILAYEIHRAMAVTLASTNRTWRDRRSGLVLTMSRGLFNGLFDSRGLWARRIERLRR